MTKMLLSGLILFFGFKPGAPSHFPKQSEKRIDSTNLSGSINSKRIVTSLNLAIGYSVSGVSVSVAWHLNPGEVGQGNLTAIYQHQTITTMVSGSAGSFIFFGTPVQPNVVQELIIGNSKVHFIWGGVNSGSACTVLCQPGPATACP